MQSKIHQKIISKENKKKNYHVTLEAIYEIFDKTLIDFAKNNKFFYELFFTNNKQCNTVFLENLYKAFMYYYSYKTKNVKSVAVNLFKYLTRGEKYRLRKKLILTRIKNKQTKVRFKRKKKKTRKIIQYFYMKKRTMKPILRHKKRLVRFFKSKMEGRYIKKNGSFFFKNVVIHNLMKYNNFGIILKKPKKIIFTFKKFQVVTTNLCFQFLRNLLVSIHKNYKNFNFSVTTQKFYTRIFDFCMFKDLKVDHSSNHIIQKEVIDSDDNLEDVEDINALTFCTGLTVKFVIKRRNCMFHIWDSYNGYTLAKVSSGIFGYYFKKGIRKFKQYNVFVKFFKYYVNSIILIYRDNVFRKYLALRQAASKDLKLKKLKLLKKQNLTKKRKIYNFLFHYVPLISNYLKFYSDNTKYKKKFFDKFLVLDIIKIFQHIRIMNIFNIELKYFPLELKNLIIYTKNKNFRLNEILFFCISCFIVYKLEYKKIKKKERMKKRRKIVRLDGCNFLFYHRSKLSITYILTMRKLYHTKKRYFSPHWVSIYKQLGVIGRTTPRNRLTAPKKIFYSFYKAKRKEHKLISFFTLLKYIKKTSFSRYYRRFK